MMILQKMQLSSTLCEAAMAEVENWSLKMGSVGGLEGVFRALSGPCSSRSLALPSHGRLKRVGVLIRLTRVGPGWTSTGCPAQRLGPLERLC